MRHGAEQQLETMGKRLDRCRELLRTLGPESAFARGFSITMTEEGNVVRDPAQVEDGEVLETRMEGGVLRSVVRGE